MDKRIEVETKGGSSTPAPAKSAGGPEPGATTYVYKFIEGDANAAYIMPSSLEQ